MILFSTILSCSYNKRAQSLTLFPLRHTYVLVYRLDHAKSSRKHIKKLLQGNRRAHESATPAGRHVRMSGSSTDLASEDITAGIELPGLKKILDDALQLYPEIRQIVEKHRRTVYSSLKEADVRKALNDITRAYPDIRDRYLARRSELAKQGIDFTKQVNAVYEACDSLDGLSSREAYRQSDQVRKILPYVMIAA